MYIQYVKSVEVSSLVERGLRRELKMLLLELASLRVLVTEDEVNGNSMFSVAVVHITETKSAFQTIQAQPRLQGQVVCSHDRQPCLQG